MRCRPSAASQRQRQLRLIADLAQERHRPKGPAGCFAGRRHVEQRRRVDLTER